MKLDLSKSKDKMQVLARKVGAKAQDAAAFAVEKGKEGGVVAKEKYDITKREIDKKRLSPVFAEEISDIWECGEPFLIRVVDTDKKRQEAEVCNKSVGFWEKIKGENILHIYTKDADKLGIELYPHIQDGLYCPNPFKDNMFIALDDYFDYIKKARIDELETIGHKLGAKYVRITFKEKKTYFTTNQQAAKATVNKKNAAEVTNKAKEEEFSDIRVAAEVKFEGCPWPEEPEVVYFKNESDISSLIKMRMDGNGMNDILSKTYTFEANSKHGMNKETALKIDTVIKGLRCTGNGTVSSKVEAENRTLLEYVIEF